MDFSAKNMLRRMRHCVNCWMIVFFARGITECLGQSPGVTLAVGDSAPRIKVEKWLKGKAVTAFEKGHVYIMEFGFVACPPCRAGIPHMNELARKYAGKVTLISVYVYENGPNPTDTISTTYIHKVERFIEKTGNEIAFHVAVDDPTQTMADTWLRASGQPGAPVFFVVDQSGIVLWIGDATMRGLDEVVDKVVTRQFDTKRAMDNQLKNTQAHIRIYNHTQANNFKEALMAIDSLLIFDNPQNKMLYFEKFSVLLACNEDVAYAYGWELLHGQCNAIEPVLSNIAQIAIDPGPGKKPDLDLAIATAERSLALSKADIVLANMYRIYANVVYKKGDVKKAIEAQEKAIFHLKHHYKGGADDGTLAFFESSLKEYKALAPGLWNQR